MDKKIRTSAGDRTEQERRKDLSESDVKELELAGGVEGGMQAGSAGGPSQTDARKQPQASDDEDCASAEQQKQAGR